jgi:fructokinase
MMSCESDLPEVVGTGFTVLDRIYADGDFAAEELGGSCGNVLVSLAMLHRQVAPLLALGWDDIGGRLVDEFRRAGADVRYINRRSDIRSPVIAQELDTSSGQHSFSFICRETLTEFPRYQPIQDQEVEAAACALAACSVFYADRLSDSIIEAMETAHRAGALVYFEPSEVHEGLFEKALELSSIVKYSSERLGPEIDYLVAHSPALAIVTHGADGLEVRKGSRGVWCKAVPAQRVSDTSGSGDMVSVGLIDWLLSSQLPMKDLRIDDLLMGVVAGQHLAAANCAFTGARGLFRDRGAVYARYILQGSVTHGL